MKTQAVEYLQEVGVVGRAFEVGPGKVMVAPEKLVELEGEMGLVGHLDVARWSRRGWDVASTLGYK